MNPGIYKNMNIDEYHENRMIVSSTGLKQAKKSSRHFAQYLVHGSESKPQFDFGNAFELAIMDEVNGTNLFDSQVAVIPTEDWVSEALAEKPDLTTPKASKSYRDNKRDFEVANKGKYLIEDVGESESYEALHLMVNSCLQNKVIEKLLTGTQYQVSLCWKDEQTGVLCKTRPDVCKTKKNVIVDIKTCKDASPHGFARDAANLEYPMQAIMQIEGSIATGLMDKVDSYFWLAVEKTAPYNACLYEFQQEDIEFFRDGFGWLLDRCGKVIKEIMNKKGIYDIAGYGENADNQYGIMPLEIPLWYRSTI